MRRTDETPTIIELDDPMPLFARAGLGIGAVLLLALLVLPFVIDPGSASTANRPPARARSTETRICRPSINVPELLEPVAGLALPNWMRLCDWVVEPVIEAPSLQPADD